LMPHPAKPPARYGAMGGRASQRKKARRLFWWKGCGAASVRGSAQFGLFHTVGGLFDQGGDGLGVGDIDSVAARDLNNWRRPVSP
jgi:hypothetical protein